MPPQRMNRCRELIRCCLLAIVYFIPNCGVIHLSLNILLRRRLSNFQIGIAKSQKHAIKVRRRDNSILSCLLCSWYSPSVLVNLHLCVTSLFYRSSSPGSAASKHHRRANAAIPSSLPRESRVNHFS